MARGDHIFVYCLGYSHHGVDCGDGQVIHFDSDPVRKMIRNPNRPPQIVRTSFEAFAKGREVLVRHYALSDDPEVVVDRAERRLGESGYELFHNNCEHFAIWCKTGSATSTQVEDFRDATKPLKNGLAAAAVIMRSARHLPGRARPIAYGAALAVTAGAFAFRYADNRLKRFVRGES